MSRLLQGVHRSGQRHSPSFPYTTNPKGRGPAAGGSLFENNAEYGMGIWLSVEQQRQNLALHARELAAATEDKYLRSACEEWLGNYNDTDGSRRTGEVLKAIIEAHTPEDNEKGIISAVRENFDHLAKKSVWFFV